MALTGSVLTGSVLMGSVSATAAGAAPPAVKGGDWPTYGHDPGGMRFSPLSQINAGNVGALKPAWIYHMKPATPAAAASQPSAAEIAQRAAEGAGPAPAPAAAPAGRRRFPPRPASSEATPLVVGGLMYVTTPYKRVVALEPETGKEVWAYEVKTQGQASLRGVEYWPGDASHPAEILFGTRDGFLIALDARTGHPVTGFGKDGVLDLKTPEVMQGYLDASYGMTSPPIVYRNLVITGAANQEFPAHGAAGDVRAWDVRTGKLVWTFHSVAQPGEPGHETWEGDSWKGRSGTNVWGFMTVDAKRGIAYLPFGAPTWDRYGGDRKGANLYGTALVAVDANTGKHLWHFQVVHHDIWDKDLEAPPALIDVKVKGKTVPAVALVSKSGLFFLFDRVSGKPIYPIEERPVPAAEGSDEAAWPTQPFPVVTPPYARQSFQLSDVATVTPELEAYCRKLVVDNQLQGGGPYLPTGISHPIVQFPGYQGGANWGGGSFDPKLGYFFVNSNDFGQIAQNTVSADGAQTADNPVLGRFWQPQTRLPCQQPPWGALTAIDVNTGKIAWTTPLGVSDNLPAGLQKTGRPNVGGSIATAGGLVFIAATDDARFRAFDARTGKELWTWRLGAAGHATPITYLGKDGKQYVAVVGTGGSFLDSPVTSDALEVFRLP
ncbi:pyrroloquinoline quinone-dependent dehydrogenase [Phenylobacterium soli]|uniref:Pyrroloquinoline quinone-dependent dehydrogenase n=2 Tax=Phenylobacterium soli TaxID=2170551 RepID=A0A328AB17_9CAUL|nr:pyrroloquinoline quinone-dependent dehydrogenase [Phenylobacterium soli]